MDYPFEVARQTRKNTLYFLDGLDEEKINRIPEGFRNNIAWNFGHILVTFELLVYHNSGLPMRVSDEWVEKYRKGSVPDGKTSMEEFEEMRSLFVDLIDKAEEDHQAGRFKEYGHYKTSYGIDLSSVEDVINFIYAHEAFHWGTIVALKKLV